MSMTINMPLGDLIDKSPKGKPVLRMRNGCAPM